jgi:DNA-binding transcriptional MerR regulator
MFTSSQVSEMTGVASSTLRKYVAQFRHRFGEATQTLRGRRFTEEDVALVKNIKNLFAHGLSINEVERRLGPVSKATEGVDDEGDDASDIHPMQEVLADQNEFIEQVEQIKRLYDEKLASFEIEIKQLRAAVHRSKEDYDRLSRKLDEMENTSIWKRFSGGAQPRK